MQHFSMIVGAGINSLNLPVKKKTEETILTPSLELRFEPFRSLLA